MTDRLIDADDDNHVHVTSAQYFAVIPEWVLYSAVTSHAIRLYCVLSRYEGRRGDGCYPSKANLQNRLCASEATVERAIKELVEIGAVEVTPRWREDGSRSSNTYHLNPVPPSLRGDGVTPPPFTREPPPGITREPPSKERTYEPEKNEGEAAAAAAPQWGEDREKAERMETLLMRFSRKWQEDRTLLEEVEEIAAWFTAEEIAETLAWHRRTNPGKPPWPRQLRPHLEEIVQRKKEREIAR